jgi:hypothetical protein
MEQREMPGFELPDVRTWRALAKARKLPPDVPSNPVGVYRTKGWVSWGDWLGTGVLSSRKRRFLPFAKARA